MSNFMQNYELLDTQENLAPSFGIHPNPAKGTFTVEGVGIMRIANVLGQVVMAKEIHGKETIELPQGLYFVTLNGQTRKVVVE